MILMATLTIITTAGVSTTMGTAAATIMTLPAATLHAVIVMGKVVVIPVYTVVDIALKKTTTDIPGTSRSLGYISRAIY
jgi:hypothetical protein